MLYSKKIRNTEWIVVANSEAEAEEKFQQIEKGEIPE